MLKIKKKQNSLYLRDLPKGCKLCKQGKKLVIFVTGLCPKKCFYCPLSDSKKDKDLVWANEWQIKSDKELLTECELINAKGAGITGGDPLVKIKRTQHFIKLLKSKYKNFHIHLYTSPVMITKKKLDILHTAGLDEIRLHPDLEDTKHWDKIKIIKEKRKWDVGIEIPVIPGQYQNIIQLIEYSKNYIDFLNLNELEVSDNNANSIIQKGFTTINDSYAIKGSKELAKKILNYCAKNNLKLKVNFCSTKVKDSEQMQNRILRRAKNVAKNYDYVTDEGMLIRGAIYPIITPTFNFRAKLKELETQKNKSLLIKIKNEIQKENKTPNHLIDIDFEKLRILTDPKLIENIKTKYKKAIVTEYPTKDGFEVDIEFIN